MDEQIVQTILKALRREIRPDDVFSNLPQLPLDLKLEYKREEIDDIPLDSFLIEGSQESLLAMAALLIAQAQSKSDDCGYQVAQFLTFGKPKLFQPTRSWELYIHRLPCSNRHDRSS